LVELKLLAPTGRDKLVGRAAGVRRATKARFRLCC
jgi:hypothetical protein